MVFDPQMIVAAVSFFAGVAVPFLTTQPHKMLILCGAIFVLGVVAIHFLYPQQYADAMWMIGAAIAWTMNACAIIAGTVTGRLAKYLIGKI